MIPRIHSNKPNDGEILSLTLFSLVYRVEQSDEIDNAIHLQGSTEAVQTTPTTTKTITITTTTTTTTTTTITTKNTEKTETMSCHPGAIQGRCSIEGYKRRHEGTGETYSKTKGKRTVCSFPSCGKDLALGFL